MMIDATSHEYRSFSLSIPAARTIVCLLESGGAATVGRLAETTSIEISTMSHILRRLEALGYLDRERQKADNRVVLAILTASGRGVAEACREASLRHEAVLTRSMTSKEVEALKRSLDIAYENARDNFGRAPGQAGGAPARRSKPSAPTVQIDDEAAPTR